MESRQLVREICPMQVFLNFSPDDQFPVFHMRVQVRGSDTFWNASTFLDTIGETNRLFIITFSSSSFARAIISHGQHISLNLYIQMIIITFRDSHSHQSIRIIVRSDLTRRLFLDSQTFWSRPM